MATKADLDEFELRLDVRFSQLEHRSSQLEQRLEQKLADVQIGLIKWFAGMAIAQAAVIVALVKLLPGPS